MSDFLHYNRLAALSYGRMSLAGLSKPFVCSEDKQRIVPTTVGTSPFENLTNNLARKIREFGYKFNSMLSCGTHKLVGCKNTANRDNRSVMHGVCLI
jgi:hypothetical protein